MMKLHRFYNLTDRTLTTCHWMTKLLNFIRELSLFNTIQSQVKNYFNDHLTVDQFHEMINQLASSDQTLLRIISEIPQQEREFSIKILTLLLTYIPHNCSVTSLFNMIDQQKDIFIERIAFLCQKMTDEEQKTLVSHAFPVLTSEQTEDLIEKVAFANRAEILYALILLNPIKVFEVLFDFKNRDKLETLINEGYAQLISQINNSYFSIQQSSES